jgi:hypothetical protein
MVEPGHDHADQIAASPDQSRAAPVGVRRRGEDRLIQQVFPVAGELAATGEAIDAGYVAGLLARDWGFHHTATANLAGLRDGPAANGTGGGAIAAMKGAGIDPSTRPTTGQDAELAAVQRILTGEQYMTVYKAIKPEAEAAAELAVALVRGEDPPSGLVNDKVDNGMEQVPSILLTPVAVTKDNINDTIVKDEFWSVDEICTGKYAAACKEAGIQ